MMKTCTAILGLWMCAGSLATALQYVENNPADVYLYGLNKSYSGQFSLLEHGYNPALETIESAEIRFTLWDLGLKESWEIKVGGSTFASGGDFSGFLYLNDDVTGTLLADLDESGILNYTVQLKKYNSILDAFWLKNARLSAKSSLRQPRQDEDWEEVRVPEGGSTAVLLGMAVAGLFALRQKSSA